MVVRHEKYHLIPSGLPASSAAPSARGARVATLALDEARFEARGADGLEALHTTAHRRGLGRGWHDVRALDRGVPVQPDLVVWGPTSGAATPRTDELHGHAKRLRAGDLRALLRVGFPREVGLATVG